MTALGSLALSLAVPLLSLALVLASLRRFLIPHRSLSQRLRVLAKLGYTSPHIRIVSFFHPYCNAGGGGERVLWTALACMQRMIKGEAVVFVVYTGDVGHGKASKDEILAKSRFDITLSPSTLHFIPLENRWLVEDSTYPRLTLLGQSVGSVLLALEGLIGPEGCVPDVWIDTMGYAFAYPLVKYLCRIPVLSYTHYPTISTSMIHRVSSRLSTHTNSSFIASSRALSALKLAYYVVFARCYSWSLRKARVVWVNSSWTRGHVEGLIGAQRAEEEQGAKGEVGSKAGQMSRTSELRQRRKGTKEEPSSASPAPTRSPERANTSPRVRLLYPPCDTLHLSSLPLSTSSRIGTSNPILIFSLAQFRPEKEHSTQLRALASLLSSPTLPPSLKERIKLVCAGSVRNEVDAKRVEALRALAGKLGVEDKVEFVVNAEYGQICEWMRRASVGLHTMVDEHFGITVVEFQAAGLIPLAHASAGPLLDILLPSRSGTPTGFLAPSPSSTSSLPEAFAAQLEHIVSLPSDQQDRIREAARRNAQERFSVARFEEGWMSGWREFVDELDRW
ncbi:mannosyltransferase [Rhodotorula toruloides]|uniref:GDP-Man:Man(3)GlcNAc(2)-PP-Dol alpha-1,2-mannosyltransferase n=1 Tax=Rhodotorula toruloides TaxID=5286 RepID=A0A511KK70_RHOTO|nr:mannosyltransferase [Rhodotorula toruloides]